MSSNTISDAHQRAGAGRRTRRASRATARPTRSAAPSGRTSTGCAAVTSVRCRPSSASSSSGLLFTLLRPEHLPDPAATWRTCADQAAPIIILAMGLVFVLLLGEIDLSAGVVSGVCAAVMAKLLADVGSPWYVAVLAAIVTGVLIGLFTGSLVGLVGIPSFVVTLALFLGWQGFTLRLIGEGGTVPVRDPVISALSDKNLPVVLGWVLAVVIVLAYAALQLNRWRTQRAKGLAHRAAGARRAAADRRHRRRRPARHRGAQRRPGARAGRRARRHPVRDPAGRHPAAAS